MVQTFPWVLPLTLALAIAGAVLLYVTVEAPIDRWRQRRVALAAREAVLGAAPRGESVAASRVAPVPQGD